ncbi:MAG: hypothetical protein DMG16_13525 [Acidobacteria bacterium]|nr:MAG: hypothetical protein DMG16_13525 [Acidobacteriota bacterium]
MTVDCQWIEKNLEALFCDTLSPEQNRIARAHIESCDSCGKEVATLKAIDPLVKRYFQSELDRALRVRVAGRRLPASRFLGLGSAALVAASVLLVFALRTPPQRPATAASSSVQGTTESQSSEATPVVKSTDAVNVERAKPDASASVEPPQTARAAAATNENAPQFLVTDPAGYSRTLSDYRGYVLVIGVLNVRQADSASNLERLYKAFGSNPKFRFVAVSLDRQPRPAETTFPVTYNEGSTLFGAKPGDFVLLDQTGSIQLRGSLVKDYDSLFKRLQEN